MGVECNGFLFQVGFVEWFDWPPYGYRVQGFSDSAVSWSSSICRCMDLECNGFLIHVGFLIPIVLFLIPIVLFFFVRLAAVWISKARVF